MSIIGYRMCERFDPSTGARWTQYIEWSGLAHLKEVTSLDCVTCPSVLPELEGEDWNHLVYGPELGDTLDSLEYLVHRRPVTSGNQVLAVVREPRLKDVEEFRRDGFRFMGYDLVDVCGTSALVNCVGLGDAYRASDLSSWGLVMAAATARGIQAKLPSLRVEEHHAHCDMWAVWRMEDA